MKCPKCGSEYEIKSDVILCNNCHLGYSLSDIVKRAEKAEAELDSMAIEKANWESEAKLRQKIIDGLKAKLEEVWKKFTEICKFAKNEGYNIKGCPIKNIYHEKCDYETCPLIRGEGK